MHKDIAMRVAITGNIGSGKSHFARLLSALLPDRPLFDADSVTHDLYQDAEFLSAVEGACGSRERSAVSRACFADPAARRRVELASLPLWGAAIERALAPERLIAEFPLLMETSQYAERFDLILCVEADEGSRLERVARRSGWSAEHTRNAFSAQLGALAKAGAADGVVPNQGSLADLEAQARHWAGVIRAFESLSFEGLPAALPRHILRAHCEPHRAYHGLAHLAALQRALAPFQADLREPQAVALAVLFHDFCYDTGPRYPDNEARSVQALWRFARDRAPELARMDPQLRRDTPVALASELIAATKRHAISSPWLLARQERASDCALFLDADLSILAAGEPELLAYDEGIRQEFIHVPLDVYKSERVKALSSLLSRERVFLSPQFAPLNARARANLSRLIQLTQERA